MKNKNTLVCAIDASKAFDKINRARLMHKLIGKLSMPYWRLLYHYYESSKAYVLNNNETSELFKTTIGVKQAGPLSPKLFCIYVDDLIKDIQSSRLGCEISSHKISCLMYADDLLYY